MQYTALIVLQNKALGTWNSLIQKSGFPKLHHYARQGLIQDFDQRGQNKINRILGGGGGGAKRYDPPGSEHKFDKLGYIRIYMFPDPWVYG